MNKDDKNFLKEKLNKEISVPESLSSERIENLISGEAQQKSAKKGVIRRFAAVAVAACIVITSLFFLSDKNSNMPDVFTDESETQAETQVGIQPASSYDEILGYIKDYAESCKNSKDKNYYFLYSSSDDALGSVTADITMNGVVEESTADSLKGTYGEVNLRDKNVREADIFITDGKYIYSVDNYNKAFKITKADKDGSLEILYSQKETSLNTDGNGTEIFYHELYKYENYLIIGFTRYKFQKNTYTRSVSGVMIYDISDKSAPALVKEISLDGHYISSRISDGKLIFINSYRITDYFYGKDDSVLIPAVYNGGEMTYVPCDCIVIPEDEEAQCYVNVAKINLSDIDGEIRTASFLGRAYDTYCTKDTLYLMGTKYPYEYRGVYVGAILISELKTTLSAIDISGDGISYRCTKVLDGTVINSYAIDDYNGYVRIALQKKEDNSILILDKNLEKVSELSGIAKGEQIKSARFTGNTAYVVTFVQTDPLFVIDLSNPENPKILGEVKLPGFSSYLHPVGDGLLAGIGVGGTESGIDGSSKISLFDVTNPASPKEISSLVFPDSQLGTVPKAFCSVSESSFLVTYENWRLNTDAEYYTDADIRACYIYTGALLIEVENGELVLKNSYLTKHLNSVDRATFIEDRVYIFACGSGSIASFDMDSGKLISAVNDQKDEYNFLPADKPSDEILF